MANNACYIFTHPSDWSTASLRHDFRESWEEAPKRANLLDAAKQEVGVFLMIGCWQRLREHVGWIVSTSEPGDR